MLLAASSSPKARRFEAPPNLVVSTTQHDPATVRQVFTFPVTAGHWAANAFHDLTVDVNADSVTQVDSLTLDWDFAGQDAGSGDTWGFDSVADGVPPDSTGVIL